MSLESNVEKKSEKVYSRQEVVRVAIQQGTQAAVVKFNISGRTIRSWKSRFKRFGIEGLKDKSRAPKRVHNRKDLAGRCSELLKELVENEPGLKNCQIFAKLVQNSGTESITLSWIKKAKKRLKLVREVKVTKVKEHTQRYEIEEPGYLQIDTKVVKSSDDLLYQFTAIDECSRVRFLWSSSTKGAMAAAKFLELAHEFFMKAGVHIKRVQTDNGTEYTLPSNQRTIEQYLAGKTEDSVFTRKCHELNIQHRLIKPYSPELNGKVERSHRTDQQRIYTKYKIVDQYQHQRILDDWMVEYNEHRPHHSLNGFTPLDFLKRRLEEIKTKSTQGAQSELKNPDHNDELLYAA